MRRTDAIWPAVLAVAACALLVGPASAAAAPPSIESEWVTGVTEHNAVLHATINPNGSLTQYKLQIDTTGHFKFDQNDTCALHPPTVACGQIMISGEPLPAGLKEPSEGSISAGNDPVEVSADLANIGATLQPNTTYYYRAIAANGAPEVEGPSQTFTTPPTAAAPPSIESVSATNITAHDATLSAQINPNGLDTTYQFSLVSGCPLFGNEVCPTICPVPPGTCGGRVVIPLPSGQIPASFETQTVSVDLNAVGITLDPAERYGYTVEATNSAGPPVIGPDQIFRAESAPAPPATAPPSIESVSATNVTAHDATLSAQINPNGLETSYQFRLESGCLPPLACLAITTYPLPAGSIPASAEATSVSLDLNDAGVTLHPDTKYRYSVEATNSAGPPVKGPDQTFMTRPEPPSIEGQTASAITEYDVTLEALINPHGRETVYELQIDTTGNFRFYQTSGCPLNVPGVGCTTEVVPGDPLAPGLVQPPEYTLPASDEPQQVSVNMAGIGATLQPGTTYHYRVIAASGDQIVAGPDQTFTTLSSESPDSPHAAPPGQLLDSLAGQLSPPAINPAPPVSHPRRGKHKPRRNRHRRHNGSARSTRTVRR